MANVIQLKRKTTSGAPALGSLAVGEICLVIPDDALYWKKDASTLVGPIGAAGAVSWNAITGTQSDVNLSGFTNDSGFITALNAALTGVPTAPTATGGTNTTQIATTAFVQAAVSALINAAPGALDTLNELADAIGDDPNFAATITAAIATKLDANSNIDGGEIS